MIRTAVCAVMLCLAGCHSTVVPADKPPAKEPDMKGNATSNPTEDSAPPGATTGSAAGKERRARLRAAIESRAASAHDELVAAVTDPDPFVRGEVAHQVAAIRDPQALAILDRLSRDPAALVRAEVVDALAKLGGEAAHAIVLRFAIDDPSEDVRGEAVRALAQVDGDRKSVV